jgi:prominin 1
MRATLSAFIVGAALLAASCRAETGNGSALTTASPPSDNGVSLGDGPVGVYRMVDFFLNSIIQSRLMTSMPDKYTASTDALFASLTDHWQEWVIHFIGFVVCAAIGIVGFFVMLLVLFIFPCCRCCGNCGAKDPEKSKKKRKSKCCIGTCELFMVVVTVSLILSNIVMYVVNEKFYPELKQNFINDVYASVDGIDDFLKEVPAEIKTTVVDGYVDMLADVFHVLDSVPANAMRAIDNATDGVTTVTELSTFSHNLPLLNRTLADAVKLSEELDVETSQLWNSFKLIRDNITSKLTQCSDTRCQVCDIVHLSIN